LKKREKKEKKTRKERILGREYIGEVERVRLKEDNRVKKNHRKGENQKLTPVIFFLFCN
jgi:hypothetical protein